MVLPDAGNQEPWRFRRLTRSELANLREGAIEETMTFSTCRQCVLEDSPGMNLGLDASGICCNCHAYRSYVASNRLEDAEANADRLQSSVGEIKFAGMNSEYDSVLGLSGGMDSSYLALQAKRLGLRPLVVHFDNGWNSETAVRNVQNAVDKLKLDLHTYVIDWQEFKDLQLSYLKASVVDIEVPTDHFIYATLFEVASKFGIRSVLDGNNHATEFSGGSWKWSFDKTDLHNLRAIHRAHGGLRLRRYPKLGPYQRFYYREIRGIRTVRLLDHVPYRIADVAAALRDGLDWQDPGGKHYESVFTRFYQGYILPRKFGIDKRRIHYSNLIWSGQMTRERALELLQAPPYPVELQRQDREYFMKKLDYTERSFEEMMHAPVVPHEDYGTEADSFRLPLRVMGKALRVYRSFRVRLLESSRTQAR